MLILQENIKTTNKSEEKDMKTKIQTTKTRAEYEKLIAKLNGKYPNLNAKFQVSPWGGRFEIEVSTVDKAKSCDELFNGFTFISGMFK